MNFRSAKTSLTYALLFLFAITLLNTSCKKDEEVNFTGTYINQTDDCYDNGYVLIISPLGGNEYNISGIGNNPDIIIVGEADGNDIDLTTTTLFDGALTVSGSGVLVDGVFTLNYTVSQSGVGSSACTGIFNN